MNTEQTVSTTSSVADIDDLIDFIHDDDDDSTQLTGTTDETKKAFAKVLEFITNTFYRTDENQPITITVTNKGGTSLNFYDKKQIVLAEGLIDAFGALNLPRFTVYYHELGHHLYSQGMFKLVSNWAKINQGPLTWEKKYHHLLNWIEDYFIEDKIIKEHPYLTDVLTCIKRMPPEYNINAIEYAFNFWYINQAPTPALQYVDQIAFRGYVTKLLTLRDMPNQRFGSGILSVLSIKQSTETRFALLLIEFYNWCVGKGIFPPDQPLPTLQNPNNHLEGQGQGQGQSNQQGQGNQQGPGQGNDGSSSPHSRQVGKNSDPYKEVYHIKSPTTIFKDEINNENRMINKEVLDMSQRVQTENASLDGLFSTKHRDSAIIQPKVIVPNFFNPNRIMDQVLFKEKEHAYMNVAVYRDISGSTEGKRHTLMHHVCEQLHKDIPVDITYYLYSSGDISILEVPYVPWEDDDDVPDVYTKNPLFKKLDGGTNSSAIADVITQQLSDKWLNIIVTDGDLDDLMRRDNIMSLLKNVFVINVHSNSPIPQGLLGVDIKTEADIETINSVLSGINIDR